MPQLEELVWAQEEPRNNGAWFFVEPLIEACLNEAGHLLRPRYAGRDACASPATGLAKRHAAEQAALIAAALGHTSQRATPPPKPAKEGRACRPTSKFRRLGNRSPRRRSASG